jgi:hypothetical protein
MLTQHYITSDKKHQNYQQHLCAYEHKSARLASIKIAVEGLYGARSYMFSDTAFSFLVTISGTRYGKS